MGCGSRARGGLANVLVIAALMAARSGTAAEPDALPEPLWWRGEVPANLARDPLESLEREAGASWAFEWAPLFDGPQGERVRQERSTLHFVSPGWSWRWGLELESSRATNRLGESDWLTRVERPRESYGAGGVAFHGKRVQVGLALGASDGEVGGAASIRWKLDRRVTVDASTSRWAQSGILFVRWEDDGLAAEVDASGRWREERSRARIDLMVRRWLGIKASLETLGRSPIPGEAEDHLDREFDWKAYGLEVRARLPGVSVEASLEHGSGRQELSVSRRGTAYVRAEGPLASSQATLLLEPASLPVEIRAWDGHGEGDARGHVAMWPFDGLLGLIGSQRAANGAATLDHDGLSVDLHRRAGPGFDGGVAVWRMAPRATFSSWRSAFFGLGREDESFGETRIRSLTALGLRGAVQSRWGGTGIRLELVQWVPVNVSREPQDSPSGPGEAGMGSDEGAGGTGGSSGGTIVRVTVTSTENGR